MDIIAFLLLTGFAVSGCVVFADWIERNARSAIGQYRRDQVENVDWAATAKRLGGGEAARGGSGQVRTGEDIARLHGSDV